MNDRPNASPGALSVALLLLSAVVVFGAILSGYALLRINDPGAFTWAPTLLDRRLGAITAAGLVVSLIAAAGAFRLAGTAKARPARILLSIAIVASLATIAVRGFEFPSTSLRAGLAPVRTERVSNASRLAPVAAVAHVGDAAPGKKIYLGTCASCHAIDGSGVKGQGQNLKDSVYLKDKTDDKALAFVKTGRQPFDPESKLHLAMPARGGNPALSDANLLDAIAYVRELQKAATAAAASPVAAVKTAAVVAATASPDQPQVIDGELWLPHSILPPAQAGPGESARAIVALQRPGAVGRALPNVRRFFSILLLVNGLHALYSLFGIGLASRLLVGTARGTAPSASLAIAALYWVVISAIGLALIPAFYM